MKTRFAPSPTGLMHFGNLRTALFNYLFANKSKGIFLLRIEDTDLIRSKEEYCACLLDDLKWAGITFNEGPYKQSQRSLIYAEFYQKLEEASLAYPCFCSEQQLAINRKLQLASGKPPRYSGACKNLSKGEIQAKINAGQKPVLRFRVPQNTTIEFNDLLKGQQSFNSNDIGDFIIRRQDGSPSFMFCNAIDDVDMSITHVLRGEDHLTNTPRQIMILNALQLSPPLYGHFPMINGHDGTPLSKRNGSQTIQSLREQGYLPLAIINYLARLGHYYNETKFLPLSELIKQFDLAHINSAPAKYDELHLKHWQKENMLNLTVAEFWKAIKINVERLMPETKYMEFAKLIQPNILMPNEASGWGEIFFNKVVNIQDQEKMILKQAGTKFFKIIYDYLITNSSINFQEILKLLKGALNCTGKKLFMPIRIALTGKTHGPELENIMELMGIELVRLRIENALELIKLG